MSYGGGVLFFRARKFKVGSILFLSNHHDGTDPNGTVSQMLTMNTYSRDVPVPLETRPRPL